MTWNLSIHIGKKLIIIPYSSLAKTKTSSPTFGHLTSGILSKVEKSVKSIVLVCHFIVANFIL